MYNSLQSFLSVCQILSFIIKAGVNEAKGIDSIKIDSHPIDCFVL